MCVHDSPSQVILADWHFLRKLSIIQAAPVSASFVSLSSLRKRFSEHVFHKSQQPHIIRVHLSKCWSTNFCSLIVHGPTQQNPTSSHSLLKVCSNLADILLFHFRHSRQDTLSMLHKVNNYISPGSICPNTGVLLSIYLLFSVPLSKNPISSISVTNIKTCSNCQCLP